ncbi:hypothetical protein C0993_005631 [Termitomyces sp. T159_Od127]|nr:hypothetical protein C0993_005631 [Termitomyces sp. T159_Od127]
MAATFTIPIKATPFPFAALGISAYIGNVNLVFDEAAQGIALTLNGSIITEEGEIVQALAKEGGLAGDSAKTPSFFTLATSLRAITAHAELVAALDSLDNLLAYRTFLVGHSITSADWIIWGTLKGSIKVLGLLKNNQHPHLLRWFTYIDTLKETQSALAELAAAKASKARSNKTAAGFALGLQDAVDGQVVTRFPPEPSGYLHIGHTKAAILNQYFAKMYHGKLIVRFDDTNPSKEKTEFEDTILEDLKLLDIHGDVVTHTSDHFQTLYDLAVKLIESGNAYTDDTLQEQMRDERMKGIASKHRDDSVEENLRHFEEMKAGTEEGIRCRLNFIYTLLSKRKLHDFVNKGLVRGWDDPRFPTVRGIRRRGMTVEALTQFMLAQGPSQSVVSLEWDSIWTQNKKIIDPIAPRHWSILTKNNVPVTIKGGPASPEVKAVPKHKKNAEIGDKKTVYSSSIIVEQEDAQSFEDQEEVTLMDWGNAIVRSKTVDASGVVTAIEMELNLEGDFRKTKKKITWLSQSTSANPLAPVTLLDYDYLITKKKLEEGDDVADFITPVTEFREEAVADANVKDLKKGDIIQFERKGYYIYDGEVDSVKEFILIPDGRAASIASKAALGASPAAAVAPVGEAPITKMYGMDCIYGKDVKVDAETMYKMDSIYDS